MGSSIAWWLTRNPEFRGSVTVIEPDPTYATASTSHTNSCLRQQFSSPVNIQLSQFTAEFIRDLPSWMGPNADPVRLIPFGYLYLSQQPDALRETVAIQHAHGVGTDILDPQALAQRFPFLNLDGVELGAHNPIDEGYFDGATLFDNFRRGAKAQGAAYVQARVTGVNMTGGAVSGVHLTTPDRVDQVLPCDLLINAAGTRAADIARMVGLDLPVEPRKRFSFVFDSATPIDGLFPLIIDPSGIHVRPEGKQFLAGCTPDPDVPVDPDDFDMDHDIWMDRIWPTLLERIPAFDRLKVTNAWAGHYAYNTWDQNALIGPHPDCPSVLFANGFSGHGLQQAAGIGRGLAEWIIHGKFQSVDLTDLTIKRLQDRHKVVERAVI